MKQQRILVRFLARMLVASTAVFWAGGSAERIVEALGRGRALIAELKGALVLLHAAPTAILE